MLEVPDDPEEPDTMEYAGFIREDAYRASDDPTRWCFDSGATSMCTGNKVIFEHMDKCRGTLIIASGMRMLIKGHNEVQPTEELGSEIGKCHVCARTSREPIVLGDTSSC